MRSRKIASRLPLLPRMLPNRTTMGRAAPDVAASATSSARRFVAPMTLRGAAALSDEMSTKRAPASRLASTTFAVPSTLAPTAAQTSRSIIDTCL